MRLLFATLLLLLLTPPLLTGTLGGSLVGHEPAPAPGLPDTGWWDGSWQARAEAYLNHHFGQRNDFVRLYNWKDYFLFGELHAFDVVEGRDGYLYEEAYIRAATGRDARPPEELTAHGDRLARLRDSLTAHGTELLVVFAPGKGSYFSDHWPAEYADDPYNPVNERRLERILNDRSVPVLNFNRWFREMKDTVTYPLFPKQGIHWTEYGSLIGTDSIIRYLEQRLAIDMPDLEIMNVEWSDEQRGITADLWNGANMGFPATGFPIGYPVYRAREPDNEQPRTLVIGDSYYWDLYLMKGISNNFFDGGDFWYYFYQHMRGGENIGKVTDNVTLPDELYTYDVVMLLFTEHHYADMGGSLVKAFERSLE